MKKAILIFAVFLLSSAARAEEPSRGRLADGRAYRTDSQGSQIVDYIAELELANDALKRQVEGLKIEAGEKQALLDKIKISPAAPIVKEKDLINRVDSRSFSELDVAPPAPPKPELLASNVSGEGSPSLLGASNPGHSSEDETAALRLELDRLREDVAGKEAASQKKSEEHAALQANHERQKAELRAQVVQLERALSDAEADAKAERLRYQNALKYAPIHLADEQSLAASSGQGANLAFLSAAKRKTINESRGNILDQAAAIQEMILERDRLFAGYVPKSSTVSFRVSEAVSSRNLSLKEIKEEVGIADSLNELTALRVDLSEIQKKIADDIAILKKQG